MSFSLIMRWLMVFMLSIIRVWVMVVMLLLNVMYIVEFVSCNIFCVSVKFDSMMCMSVVKLRLLFFIVVIVVCSDFDSSGKLFCLFIWVYSLLSSVVWGRYLVVDIWICLVCCVLGGGV